MDEQERDEQRTQLAHNLAIIPQCTDEPVEETFDGTAESTLGLFLLDEVVDLLGGHVTSPAAQINKLSLRFVLGEVMKIRVEGAVEGCRASARHDAADDACKTAYM